MRDAMAGVGWLRVDLSPPGSVIAIDPPHLMVLGVAHY